MGSGEDGCGGCVEVVRMMGGHKCSLDSGMSGLVFKTASSFAYNRGVGWNTGSPVGNTFNRTLTNKPAEVCCSAQGHCELAIPYRNFLNS